jgi:cold shock CspA family protein
MSERKQGIVCAWHKDRGFGRLRVGPESSLEQYFLHVSSIRSGTATPKPGMEVFFEVDESKSVPESTLPRAIRADVIVPDEAVSNDNR